MIKVSDYIARYLADYGVRHVFMLTGGGSMHLNDSFGREKRFQCIFNHHEQACAIAAEGYSRLAGSLGVVSVTTGPGGTNAITGTLGQWLDSIPVLYVSGQVRIETTAASTGLPLRQLGDQEADIVAIVKPITKYAVTIKEPKEIGYHLAKAIHEATSGRPGPVWLDIPLDIQAALVDEEELAPYKTETDDHGADCDELQRQVRTVLEKIVAAQRPVILAGAGIRLAGANEAFGKMIDLLGIPVLVAWDAIDALSYDHALYFGRPSTLGQRGANFIFQNADLILSIGCRLNTRQIGFNFKSVARRAYKIFVDIDEYELRKPTISPDLPVNDDARLFIDLMVRELKHAVVPANHTWLDWCKERKKRYSVLSEHKDTPDGINPYIFCDVLSDCLNNDDIIVSSNGSACVVPIQTLKIRKGQRHIVNSGCAAMGYGLPAAIGAGMASGRQRIVCLEGDGSIQLNIQELQTLVHYNLPVKIFVFNNNGYLSIRTTQINYFNGHLVGESPQSGVSFPDMLKVATAYGIPNARLTDRMEMKGAIQSFLDGSGPFLCEVILSPSQQFSPRVASRKLPDGKMVSSPLEDMYPFLEREEFFSNMIIPEWDPDFNN